jgi:hypothetical protein
MSDEIQQLKDKIEDYEQRKKIFMEWIENGEPNPVFKRLYKRKFTEILGETL